MLNLWRAILYGRFRFGVSMSCQCMSLKVHWRGETSSKLPRLTLVFFYPAVILWCAITFSDHDLDCCYYVASVPPLGSNAGCAAYQGYNLRTYSHRSSNATAGRILIANGTVRPIFRPSSLWSQRIWRWPRSASRWLVAAGNSPVVNIVFNGLHRRTVSWIKCCQGEY